MTFFLGKMCTVLKSILAQCYPAGLGAVLLLNTAVSDAQAGALVRRTPMRSAVPGLLSPGILDYPFLPSCLVGKRTALTDVALTRGNMGSNVQLHTRQHITKADAEEPRV